MKIDRSKRTKVTTPFYERVMREGIDVIGGVDQPTQRTQITNPYFIRAAKRRQGRPKKGAVPDLTQVKSIRLPAKIWMQLDAQAEREGTPPCERRS